MLCPGNADGQISMKILIVDDHVLIREAMRRVFAELQPDAVVLEAVNSHQALQYAERNPDLQLVTLDLNLPDRDGFEVLTDLRESRPDVSVIIVSAFDDRETVSKSLDMGAIGFIPKGSSRDVMLSAFKLIFSGGVYVPPEILAKPHPIPTAAYKSAARHSTASQLGLTVRQMDVLALMMEGKSNKVICRILRLAEPTVKGHVKAILRSLKAANRTEAVIAAIAMGLGHAEKSDG
jgi:DNA-binding NarL/FixJ family response regulator